MAQSRVGLMQAVTRLRRFSCVATEVGYAECALSSAVALSSLSSSYAKVVGATSSGGFLVSSSARNSTATRCHRKCN